jgi:hypothetical protein
MLLKMNRNSLVRYDKYARGSIRLAEEFDDRAAAEEGNDPRDWGREPNLSPFCSRGMNGETQFLHYAADKLRQLAERAPDISQELHQFADELERLATEAFTDRSGPEARKRASRSSGEAANG